MIRRIVRLEEVAADGFERTARFVLHLECGHRTARRAWCEVWRDDGVGTDPRGEIRFDPLWKKYSLRSRSARCPECADDGDFAKAFTENKHGELP